LPRVFPVVTTPQDDFNFPKAWTCHHFDRRKLDFIEILSRPAALASSAAFGRRPGSKKTNGQFLQKAAVWLFVGPESSGGWDGWLHRKEFPSSLGAST